MITSGNRIHVCSEDGDLPADFLDARDQGVLFAHTVVGWVLLEPLLKVKPNEGRPGGLNGNTYCYDPDDLGQLEVV